MRTFMLTHGHLKLLHAAYVGWQDCEYGAPEIDCKRPYGNSNVERDIVEILGLELEEVGDEGPELSQRQLDSIRVLHKETETALQIVLCTGEFQPGVYEMANEYDSRSWRRVT